MPFSRGRPPHQLEALPLPRLNGGYPFNNRAYASPVGGCRIAPEAVVDPGEEETPRRGRYVRQPARANERGVVWVPPDPLPSVVARSMAPLAAGIAAVFVARRARRKV